VRGARFCLFLNRPFCLHHSSCCLGVGLLSESGYKRKTIPVETRRLFCVSRPVNASGKRVSR
jgi:hypothetical protein